jgi:quinoprotein glucose dehydrogenase
VIPKLLLPACFAAAVIAADGDWPVYGHDPGGSRFATIAIINRTNVDKLQVAWTFRTGDAYHPKRGRDTAFEATPIYVNGTLYLGTPLGRVIALDPVTGKERWSYDGKAPKDAGFGDFANRGVAVSNGRVYIATIDARLIALDAATGKVIDGFGDNGVVNLRNGLRIPVQNFGDYEETSPPTVVGNTVIVGSGIADNGATDQPSGEVRGFDAATGKLKWTFDPMPKYPKTGAGNAWSIFAADPARGLVFVPTGSPSPDYYGGERLGNDDYSNSLVALHSGTGKVVWFFQTVHHDLWDYDVASPPILFDVHRGGRTIAAVGVGSKDGNFFVLDRASGKPIFGVEERPVPKSDVPGEVSSPTQPFPVAPAGLAPQRLTEAWGSDETNRKWCEEEISKLRSEGIFTPPSLRGSYIIPGNIGGMAWSGAAYDPDHRLLIIPTNNMGAEVRLIPRADFKHERETTGRDLKGDWEFAEQRGTPYGMMRRFLRAPNGFPCNPPPWGVLNAVDADTGEKKWSVPAGRLFSADPSFGSPTLGGPIVTAGGLVFMAGTVDSAIYAFDVTNGKVLWRGELPTSARSTPMTYRGPDGKQYLVVSAGGHGIPGAGPLGDYVVAFTLP